MIQGKSASVPPIAHTALIDFVVSRGVDRTQAREGTMPEASLAFLASILVQYSDSSRALRGLHIEKLLAISLPYLADFSREIHADTGF